MTDDDLQFLARVPAFRHVSTTGLRRLSMAITRRTVPGGTVLAPLDALGSEAFIVRRGALVLELPTLDGDIRVVARAGPQALVGEACLVAPRRNCWIIRATRSTAVYAIDSHRFGVLLAADDPGAHAVLRVIARALCGRLREATIQLQGTDDGPDVPGVEPCSPAQTSSESAWSRLKRLFEGGV